MDAAVDAVGAGMPLLADLGTVVLHLPQEVSAPTAAARCARSANACR